MGVSTTPWPVVNLPNRACELESVFSNSNMRVSHRLKVQDARRKAQGGTRKAERAKGSNHPCPIFSPENRQVTKKEPVLMADANISKRLQKTILLYSAVGMLVVGVTVGVVGVLPLARQLREAQERNLMVDLQRQTVAVEQFVTRVHTAALRPSTRPQTRERLEAYARGQLSKERVTEEVSRFLHEQMDASTNLLGVQVFDPLTNLLVRLGRTIPREHWLWPDPTARDPSVGAPLRNGQETLFVCSTPVFDSAQATVGIVMVLYQGLSLQKVIEDRTGLGRSGETIVGTRQNKALPIFFPMRQALESKVPDPLRISTVYEGLKRALEKRTEVFEPAP